MGPVMTLASDSFVSSCQGHASLPPGSGPSRCPCEGKVLGSEGDIRFDFLYGGFWLLLRDKFGL